MRCAQVDKRLPLYVGGDVDEREADQMARHLASCPRCREAAARYDAAREALRRIGPQSPPASDWRACWRALEPKLGQTPARPRVIALPSRRVLMVRLAAAAMFLLAFGLGVMIGMRAKPDAPAAARVAERPASPDTARSPVEAAARRCS